MAAAEGDQGRRSGLQTQSGLEAIRAHQPADEAQMGALSHAQEVVILLISHSQGLYRPRFSDGEGRCIRRSGTLDVRRHGGVIPFLLVVEHLFYFRVNAMLVSNSTV